MKPTTFDEITVGEVLIWLNKLEKLESDATKVVMVKQLLTRQLSLLQTTIRECIPEKIAKTVITGGYPDGRPRTTEIPNDDYNQAIDTFTANLKEKGLI